MAHQIFVRDTVSNLCGMADPPCPPVVVSTDTTVSVTQTGPIAAPVYDLSVVPGAATVNVLGPIVGDGSVGTPLDINFALLTNGDSDDIATALCANSTAILNACLTVSSTVVTDPGGPLVGNGSLATPLDINFALLSIARANDLANRLCATSSAILSACLTTTATVNVLGPVVGDGSIGSPIDIDFTLLTNVDSDDIATALCANSAAILNACLTPAATVNVLGPIIGDGSIGTPLDIDFSLLTNADSDAIATALCTNSAAILDACLSSVVNVNGPLTGDGSIATPLDIDFSLLTNADSDAIATALCANSQAILAACLPATVVVNGPITGDGSIATPLDIDFSLLNNTDADAIATALCANSTAILNACLTIPVVANGPITGNGLLATPLDIDFSLLNNADADAIATALCANSATILNSCLSVPVVVNGPITGNGTAGTPLDINFALLTNADSDDIATALCANSVAILNACLDIPVVANGPITGDGLAGTPLDIDFSLLDNTDSDAIATALCLNSAGILSACLASSPTVVASPLIGNGTVATPLDINFALIDNTDADAIATALCTFSTAILNACLTPAAVVNVLGPIIGNGTIGTPLDIDFSLLTNADSDAIATALCANSANILNACLDVPVIVNGPITGDGLAGTPLDINFALLDNADSDAIATALCANSANILNACLSVPVVVNGPLTGNGTAGSPLDINFALLTDTDSDAIATALCTNSAAILAACLPATVTVNGPLTGNGSPGSPLDINFALMTNADADAIATSLCANSVNILEACISFCALTAPLPNFGALQCV